MPVGPIGNMNFINQNVAYPSAQLSNEVAKEGFAVVMNMVEANEKEKAATRLERVNESLEIKEEIKEKSEEEKKKQQEKHTKDKEKSLEQEEEETLFKDENHHLNLSV